MGMPTICFKCGKLYDWLIHGKNCPYCNQVLKVEMKQDVERDECVCPKCTMTFPHFTEKMMCEKEQKEKTLEKIIKSIPYVMEGNSIWFISKYVRPNEWQMAKLLDEGYVLGYDTSKDTENSLKVGSKMEEG